ncbi:hypothetical protein ACQ4M3_20580 [Leptolyngbya sp. AN03gr2]|uniref:hypothetical protein n=1 Tax=unclassified Leptolyngbya TaxID=2650499 RepID=UPI003D31614C
MVSLIQNNIIHGKNDELYPLLTVFTTLLQNQILDVALDWQAVKQNDADISTEQFIQEIETWRKKSQNNWNLRMRRVTNLELYQFFIDRLTGRINAEGEWQIPFSFPDLRFPHRPLKEVDELKLIRAWHTLRHINLSKTGREEEEARLKLCQVTEELQSRSIWDFQGLLPIPSAARTKVEH